VKIKQAEKLRRKVRDLGSKILKGQRVRPDRIAAFKAKAPHLVEAHPHLLK
jgi:hypothetical protein